MPERKLLMYVCARHDKRFVAILVEVGNGEYAWLEPIIFNNILNFPNEPRACDFAPEMSNTFNSQEAAVEAAHGAGVQVFDAPIVGFALQYFDNLGLLIKGSPEQLQLKREDFWEDSIFWD